MKRALLGVAMAAALVAGCAQETESGSPSTSSAFDKRAEKVAQSWRAAGVNDAFAPMGDLTQAPQEGFPSDELKIAFAEGRYTLSTTLASEASKGTIRFADGKRLEVPVLSADAAYRAIDKADAGDGRAALEVTSAQAGITPIQTSRGMAEVPAWRFTIKGIDHPVVRVAVSPEAIKPLPVPPEEPLDPGTHLVSAQDLTAVSANKIDYRLGVGACDKDITPLAWESADIVVIGGRIGMPPEGACTAQLILHPVSVTLSKPVGDRVILDISGSPLPRTPQ
ncbi:hypothetical protein Rhe02_08000 [Rhizocola hellebori]|uniref:Lipoprotein n=1 Tax=Rhizocola hellebori TaxID=1392758 RepID=A0A8J3Q2L3_9ACTN|nr:hypothetical protein [Rhizocola hellebori]GIH02733.1 hypothetical protein Rhe02_08000 [Rhizocola hellebori]